MRRGEPLLGLLVVVLLACGRGNPDGPRADAELQAALGLEGREIVHRILLGGQGGDEHVVPLLLEIRPGELVEFLTVDHRVHLVQFVSDGAQPGPMEFMDRTGQSASPPLTRRGSRFVLSFEDAPEGDYVFSAGGSAAPVIGRIRVRVPTER